MAIKIASADKKGGLEAPDHSWRGLPDGRGVVEVPERLADYADKAVQGGMFTYVGRSFSGFGDGKLKRPYRTPENENRHTPGEGS